MALALSEPTAQAVKDIQSWLAQVLVGCRARIETRWTYLVVTPLGMPARAWLEWQLAERGVRIKARTPIVDWPRISTALHVPQAAAARLRKAALYEAAWRALFGNAAAEAWSIEPSCHARVAQQKRHLRVGMESLAVAFGVSQGGFGWLHAFHLADEEDARAEAARLESALAVMKPVASAPYPAVARLKG